MAENITRETDASVEAYLDGVEHDGRREDARLLLALMRRATGAEPRMWGKAIIGFGRHGYRYESGREGETMRVGFSARKANLVVYLTAKGDGHDELLTRLGKHRTGVSCLYIGRMRDVDPDVLETIVANAWSQTGTAG